MKAWKTQVHKNNKEKVDKVILTISKNNEYCTRRTVITLLQAQNLLFQSNGNKPHREEG